MRVLFLLFIVVPILEMWLLIAVGSKIGALSTIALVFATAAIGWALLRQQGMDTLLRVNQRMEQGQLPASEILEGVLLAMGGALLLTPGFITDGIGFICLLPASRKALVALLLRQGVIMASYGRGATFEAGAAQRARPDSAAADEVVDRIRSTSGPGEGGNVIDGDYRRED